MGCMGNFMTQLSALPILQQVSGLLQQIALIPAKAKTGFLDGNLGEKENVYKTLFGIRVSFEAIVKEFYKQQSDKEMLCLKQSLGISQKSSHKALLFVCLLYTSMELIINPQIVYGIKSVEIQYIHRVLITPIFVTSYKTKNV